MGFLVSKLYQGQAFFVLVLKPGSTKHHSIADEFLSRFLDRFKIIYTHTSEYLRYNKLSEKGRTLSIIEMHDDNHSSLFWDCIPGMHSVMYFVDSLTEDNALSVIAQIKCIKDVNPEASVLLIIIQNRMTLEEYAAFKSRVKQTVNGVNYKIVDEIIAQTEKAAVQTDDVFLGFSWALNQAG